MALMNHDIINGLAALHAVIQAYGAMKKDVKDPAVFEEAAMDLIEGICKENDALTSGACVHNADLNEGDALGACWIPIDVSGRVDSTLRRCLPRYQGGNQYAVPVKIDYDKSFNMLIRIGEDSDIASLAAQSILYKMLRRNNALHLRCVDLVSGGNFFPAVHNFISRFPARTGGMICTKMEELSDVIKKLDSAAAVSMSRVGISYDSVWAYNQANQVKIDEYLNILYLPALDRCTGELERLKVLMHNGRRNGMRFILVGPSAALEYFTNEAEYDIHLEYEHPRIGAEATVAFSFDEMEQLTEKDIDGLVDAVRSSEVIDTRYENHPELHTEFFTMDSAEALRIPFAIDRNNVLQYFEIGGNAPTHALLAGSTGSGKSVALHTLIMQIIHNYHPDDVEIWAIDYKAVEFDTYIEQRTPHFRVIAHDTSTEFSLSLIDLLYEEYEKRQQLFLEAKVKSIDQYRKVRGKHSMPRIVVVIDEFQLMTQAVQEYTGNTDYRTRLENLLRLTRAMGLSFVLCSQTIASGLSGLSDAARDQIGCRLCLKHDDDNEIRETLMLSGPDASDIAARAKELRRGQGIYKRARWANEHSPDGKAYEYIHTYILFLNDAVKAEMIAQARDRIGSDYVPKEEIVVRGGGRIRVSEKRRHPMMQFLQGNYEPEDECVEWYPAAPTTLADAFRLELDNSAAANILMVGEDDDLRKSVVIHSVCGFLMNPENRVVASFVDENHPDRSRMIGLLKQLRSERLIMNIGVRDTLKTIQSLKRIKPRAGGNTIYLWYGLDKLKNEIFLMNQDDEEEQTQAPAAPASREDMMADLMGFLSDITGTASSGMNASADAGNALSFEDCKSILKQAFEMGPENYMLHLVIFNNRKSMKKCGLIELENFENRIGTRMSADDSYELFGSSLAISKANENTVIYYGGSGAAVPLRPYLLPDAQWFRAFNDMLSSC